MSVQVVQTSPGLRVKIIDADGRALYFAQIFETYTDGLRLLRRIGGKGQAHEDHAPPVSTSSARKDTNLTYTFGTDGKLSSISDTNGNTLTLTYTGRSTHAGNEQLW